MRLSRCETTVPVPDPNDQKSFRKSDFSAAHYELTLDGGMLVIKGRELTVHAAPAWYIVAPAAPAPAPKGKR